MKKLFDKIKSKDIFNFIFNYIQDDKFKLRFFFYSKSFQKKLNLKSSIQHIYLKKIGFNVSDYLYTLDYNKDFLNKKYEEFLLQNELNKEEIENIIFNAVNCNNIDNIEENLKKLDLKVLINIDSPLFKIISITKNFENDFIINIYENNIDDNYELFYNILNSNIKYSSIYFHFTTIKKLNYLKDLNINANKIKYLKFINKNEKSDNFFEIINNFISLKYLYIYSFNLHKNKKTELKNLKSLYFSKCKNINLSNIFYAII